MGYFKCISSSLICMLITPNILAETINFYNPSTDKQLNESCKQDISKLFYLNHLDANRIATVEKILGRILNNPQKDAIERSHLVGQNELGKDKKNVAQVGNYSIGQLRQKDRILKEANFSTTEIRKLMEHQIIGEITPNASKNHSNQINDTYKTFLFNPDANLSVINLINKTAGYYRYMRDTLGVDFETRYKGRLREIIKLLKMQSNLEKELLTDDNWKKGLASRYPLKEISITQTELIGEISYKIPEELLQDFSNTLSDELEIHLKEIVDSNTNILSLLHVKVLELAIPLMKFYSTGIRTERIIGGLMRVLPSDKRQLPKDLSAILSFLKENLPKEKNAWSKFIPSRAGLPKKEEGYTASDVIKILEDASKHETIGKNLEKVFLLYHYLSRRSGSTSVTISQAANYIANLNEEIFRQDFDLDHITTFLKQMAEESGLNEEIIVNNQPSSNKKTNPAGIIATKYITPKINSIIDKQLKIIKTPNGSQLYSDPEKIILKEVPPYIAITRGFIGGDCSTDYNWPYPNNYTDRVFYIYKDTTTAQSKFPIGYAAGVYMEVDMGTKESTNKKRVFFLHTINGVNVGNLKASMIINAFVTNPSLVDADLIAISNSGGYIDTQEISIAFSDAIKTSNLGRGIDVKFYDGWKTDKGTKLGPRHKIEKLAFTPDYTNFDPLEYDTMETYEKTYTVLSSTKSFTNSEIVDLKNAESIYQEYNDDIIIDEAFMEVLLYSDMEFDTEDFKFLKDSPKNYDRFMEQLLTHADNTTEMVTRIIKGIKALTLSQISETNLTREDEEILESFREDMSYERDDDKYNTRMLNNILKIIKTLRNANLLEDMPASLSAYLELNSALDYFRIDTNDSLIQQLSNHTTSLNIENSSEIIDILEEFDLLKNIPTRLLVYLKLDIYRTKLETLRNNETERILFLEELSKHIITDMWGDLSLDHISSISNILETLSDENILNIQEMPMDLVVYSTTDLSAENFEFFRNNKTKLRIFLLDLSEYAKADFSEWEEAQYDKDMVKDTIYSRISDILKILLDANLLQIQEIPPTVLIHSNIDLTDLDFKNSTEYKFKIDLEICAENIIETYDYDGDMKRFTELLEMLKDADLLKNIPAVLFLASTIHPDEKGLASLKDIDNYDQFIEDLLDYVDNEFIFYDRIPEILRAIKDFGLLRDLPEELEDLL